MSKTSDKRVLRMPSVAENTRIVAAAKADPDAKPLTGKQMAEMVPLKSLRGRPKSDSRKQLVSVRYSPEVIEYFRSTGEGWQVRMDGVLSDYVSKQVAPGARRTRTTAGTRSSSKTAVQAAPAPRAPHRSR